MKHGESGNKSKEYRTWLHMKGRCLTPTDAKYHRYGARGITVCDRWKDSYLNFLEDMGRAPTKDHSIERKNNNGNYEPDNCEWATNKQQSNNKEIVKLYTIDQEKLSLKQIADKRSINYNTLYYRVIKLNWSIDKAISVKVNYRKNDGTNSG